MNDVELKIEARTVFSFIFILMGIIVIFVAIFQAFLGIEHISELMGIELTDTEALIEVFGWFFSLLIEILGGYFLASIGLKIFKK